jgi:hypothetical protein
MRFTVAVVGFIIATVTRRSPIRFIARRRFRAIGPSGYALNEWSRDGMQFGQDSGGRRWMIWRWRGIETTTVTSLISKAERRMLSSILAAAEAGPSSLISI